VPAPFAAIQAIENPIFPLPSAVARD